MEVISWRNEVFSYISLLASYHVVSLYILVYY